MTVSGDRAGEGERIRDEGRSSDFSRMHRGCWLWDAGHSWVVNNTRVNHPRALSHTDTHAHGIHRHTPMHSDICMHSHTRAHTNMQSENNVYWWRAFACVKLREAVHQVTAVVISSWAPGCNRLPHFTHTHTHTPLRYNQPHTLLTVLLIHDPVAAELSYHLSTPPSHAMCHTLTRPGSSCVLPI